MRKLFDSIFNLNLLLTERFRVPIFSIRPENVWIIKTPAEFFGTLKELSSSSKRRICISSLYIGTDPLGKELVQCFSDAKCKNPTLDLNILLDYNRSTRINPTNLRESSKSILLPLVNQGAKVNFYLTYKLNGWHKSFWRREKWNELISLHHMKLYIFDDNIIISGANLSDLYFTNRQDRYVLIKDSPSLCNYFDELIKTVSKFSLNLESNGNFKLNDNWKYDPRKYYQNYFFKWAAKKEIERFNSNFNRSPINEEINENTTLVFPLLQMNTIGIRDEEEFTSHLLDHQWNEYFHMNIATGYFNLIKKYQKKLATKKHNYSKQQPINIVMASEEANGFYNGKGLLRYVPSVYTYYVQQFLKKIPKSSSTSGNNIIVRHFNRPKWSFHGKGIWLKNNNNQNKFYLTMVGSTNLGYRSVYRDNEAQIIIITKNDNLNEMFQQEFNDLVKYSKAILSENDLPRIPFILKIFSNIFRSFF